MLPACPPAAMIIQAAPCGPYYIEASDGGRATRQALAINASSSTRLVTLLSILT